MEIGKNKMLHIHVHVHVFLSLCLLTWYFIQEIAKYFQQHLHVHVVFGHFEVEANLVSTSLPLWIPKVVGLLHKIGN